MESEELLRWSLAGGAFEAWLRPPCVRLRCLPGRGVGLVARRAFAAGETVFTESAAASASASACASQACEGCGRSLARPPLESLPKAELWPPRGVSCAACGAACCGPRCAQPERRHRCGLARLAAYCHEALPLRLRACRAAPLLAARLAREGDAAGLCVAPPEVLKEWRPHVHALRELSGLAGELSVEEYTELLGRVLVNAAALQPLSAFALYFSDLKGKAFGEDAKRAAVDELLGAASAEAGVARADAVDFFEGRTSAPLLGVFRLHSKLNHSCAPNAEARSYTFADATVDVVALKPIVPGDEILITYVDPKDPVKLRARRLWENHGFVCDCARCAAPDEAEATPVALEPPESCP